MRKLIVPAFLAAVILAMPLLSACSLASGTNSDVTEKKDFSGFSNVEVGSTFDTEITHSDNYSVTVVADKSLIDLVDVTNTNGTLKVFLNPRNIFTDFTNSHKTLKVTIGMPALDSLVLSGASQGKVSGFTSNGGLQLTVSGASSLDATDMATSDATLDISGASHISGNLTAQYLDCKITGASDLTLAGQADSLDLNVSGASKIDLTNVSLQNASVNVAGASQATVNVRGTLNVDISDASQLYFYGNPTLGQTQVTGASTIKHK